MFISASGDMSDPQRLNPYAYGRNNPIAFLDTGGLDAAYFAAREVSYWRINTGRYHIYEAYLIVSQAVANQLNVDVSIPTNVSATNPFNFTLGFGPN
jgi:hypothetical protein